MPLRRMVALTLRLLPLGPTATHDVRTSRCPLEVSSPRRTSASNFRRFSVLRRLLRSAIGDCTCHPAVVDSRTRPCHCQAPHAGGRPRLHLSACDLALLNGSRLLREGRLRERRNASFPRPLGRRPAVAAVVSLPSVLANGGALANDTGVALLATRAHAAPTAIRAHRRLAAVDTLLGHVATVLTLSPKAVVLAEGLTPALAALRLTTAVRAGGALRPTNLARVLANLMLAYRRPRRAPDLSPFLFATFGQRDLMPINHHNLPELERGAWCRNVDFHRFFLGVRPRRHQWLSCPKCGNTIVSRRSRSWQWLGGRRRRRL
mmetsp:Transcript_66978/g.184591  ORF Transcript_66978/g.184591 Transcript_66978/m.184591 type:complete len:319 (-) Transcript_66978:264-1220(-)